MKTKIEKHNCLSTIAVKHTANLVIKVTIVIAVAKHIIVMFVMGSTWYRNPSSLNMLCKVLSPAWLFKHDS